MSIPDFQTIMLPLLELAGDGKEHKLSDAIDRLATHFNLTDSERRELLPSGKQAIFANRVGWACIHIKRAFLLTQTSRGKFQSTQRGLDVLAQKPKQNAGITPSVVPKFNSLSVLWQVRERGRESSLLPPSFQNKPNLICLPM
jgi:restriction endonuclease Mrr